MSRYVFQDAFERFIAALDDARLLDLEAGRVNFRRYGGGLVKESRAMYRAIAVTSVAAWEDFNEQLLDTGYNHLRKTAAKPPPDELKNWFPAQRLQAPNSNNVRKHYWAYFGLDPMPSWWFSFTATGPEIGIDEGGWFSFNDPSHREERTRRGADAAKWLDALVQLRHAAAHQDPKPYKQLPEVGVATRGRNRQWGVTRYNAQNAIAVVTQLALCTIQALAQHLDVPGQLRFLRPLHVWELAGSRLNELPQWPGGTS